MSTVSQNPLTSLSPAQEQVISLLSHGKSISAAAESAGIHRNTIGIWRRTDSTFERALATAQHDRRLLWRDLAEEHIELAISTIHDLLANPQTPPSIRLKAALALLSRADTPPPADPAVSENALRQEVAEIVVPLPWSALKIDRKQNSEKVQHSAHSDAGMDGLSQRSG
ncbi:MAG: hypothetical protein M3Z09_05590 [Acidobacteriota bacterium]|nr:hypothetical protein [Acidobacteriota bacterium]